MKPADRPHALARLDQLTRYTLDHLTTAHTEAHRQARATANLGTPSDGRAPKGSHSDPTGSAVTTMADAIARADETSRLLDDDLDTAIAALTRLTARTTTILRNSLRPNDEPAPVQKPLRGCASCARDNGHFEPIATDRYANLCRPCGQYKAAEGRLPPLGAVEYMHRYGKLTPKAIADGLRAEKAKRTSRRKAG